ncbi:MAG: helix-turn-helix domain-containing protein [Terracidiphilus sp.]
MYVMYKSLMQSLAELGEAVAARRMALGLSQSFVAARSGLTRETIVRFERGQVTEFGSRKLLAVLAVLKMEMTFTDVGVSGTLDELRIERGGVPGYVFSARR